MTSSLNELNNECQNVESIYATDIFDKNGNNLIAYRNKLKQGVSMKALFLIVLMLTGGYLQGSEYGKIHDRHCANGTLVAFAYQKDHEVDEDTYSFIDKISKYIASIKYEKNAKAVQFAKSNRIRFGIWFDPVKWQITKNYNEAAEISFGLKGRDAYAFMINEGIKAPKDVVINFILDNMAGVSEQFNVIQVEDRIINGLPVTYLRIDAMISGVHVNYMIYVYCGDNEIIQLYAYSYGSNFKDVEDFINGLSKAR